MSTDIKKIIVIFLAILPQPYFDMCNTYTEMCANLVLL